MTRISATITHKPPKPGEPIEILVDLLTIGDDFRIDDDLDDLSELAASIAEVGVLQPLLVRRMKDGWEVVAGRRRLAGARTAGLQTVPCFVKKLNADQAADAALTENLHRRNLSPIEEALAFARYREKGLTQEAIGKRVGRSQKHVSTLLSLLKLPESVRAAIHEGRLSYATALRPHERTGKRQGTQPVVPLQGSESTIISHWRRRHDRLIAGLHALQRARPRDVEEYREMIVRLLKLDIKPLEEEPLANNSRFRR